MSGRRKKDPTVVSNEVQGAPTLTISPARAKLTPAEKVDHIVALMLDGRWTAKMAHVLAAEWGCGVDAVQQRSAEASRRVRANMGDLEERRERKLAELEAIGAEARAAGEYGDAVRAVKTFGDIAGLVTTKIDAKHEVAILNLSANEKRDRLKEHVRNNVELFVELVEEVKNEQARETSGVLAIAEGAPGKATGVLPARGESHEAD